MHGIELCRQKRRTIRCSAPRWPFSPAPGSMPSSSPLAASCPEPVANNGFLLTRTGYRLSATSISGVKAPSLLLRFLPSTLVVPVRPFGSTTACRFAPVAAASLPVARYTSTTRFGLPRLRSPLPPLRPPAGVGVGAGGARFPACAPFPSPAWVRPAAPAISAPLRDCYL